MSTEYTPIRDPYPGMICLFEIDMERRASKHSDINLFMPVQIISIITGSDVDDEMKPIERAEISFIGDTKGYCFWVNVKWLFTRKF